MSIIQKPSLCLGIIVTVFCFFCGTVAAEPPFITLASTTSTQNSGLFDYILPKFKTASGISVRVVAVGTGAALRLARNGDADVLLVHHQPSEEAFVAAGYGVARHAVMYNEFIVVGPAADPADAGTAKTAAGALARISGHGAPFVSRGDDSGTHKRELALWVEAGVAVARHSGTWYRETGSGMGATLNIATAIGAYTLTDRGTWLSFQNKQHLRIVFQGDPKLRNPYGVILVSPQRHSHVKFRQGQRFIDWILSSSGRVAIADHKIDGQQLFYAE